MSFCQDDIGVLWAPFLVISQEMSTISMFYVVFLVDMYEVVIRVAHDILLIGGAVGMLLLLVVLVLAIRILWNMQRMSAVWKETMVSARAQIIEPLLQSGTWIQAVAASWISDKLEVVLDRVATPKKKAPAKKRTTKTTSSTKKQTKSTTKKKTTKK